VNKKWRKKLYTSSATSNVMEGSTVGLNLRVNYGEWNYRPASVEGKNMKGQREKGSLPKKMHTRENFRQKPNCGGRKPGQRANSINHFF
jgi:hypothetical protein